MDIKAELVPCSLLSVEAGLQAAQEWGGNNILIIFL